LKKILWILYSTSVIVTISIMYKIFNQLFLSFLLFICAIILAYFIEKIQKNKVINQKGAINFLWA